MNSPLRDLPAWGISFVINLAILLALSLIVREVGQREQIDTITSLMEDLKEAEYNFSEATAQDMQIGNEGSGDLMSSTLSAVMHTGETQPEEMQKQIEDTLVPTPVPINEAIPLPKQDMELAQQFEATGVTDVANGGVEGSMDRIAFEIGQSLKQRQTMVVWLFDASNSLNERREAIAKRFDSVYQQLQADSGDLDGLYTAVASFGQRADLLTAEPTQDVAAMVKAIRNVEPDESGEENVFSTVRLIIEKWKFWRKSQGRWNKMVFIVTDEKGDDAELLEETINQAKKYGFRVYCVGNAALFGKEQGYVTWTYDDGFEEDLPVDQGPETAFPQVLDLDFWGGSNRALNRLSASYGPYALTRLCAETGGMYLITDQSRGGMTFDQAVMREYAPDYRPVRLQEQEIKQNPAVAALVEAAMSVRANDAPLPPLTFQHPDDNTLRTQINNAQRAMAAFQHKLKEAHDLLSATEKYRKDVKDPRWRASYDLAMGRVKAMLVRYYGYNVTMANMKGQPKTFENEGSNSWRLVPSAEIETGPSVRKTAEEAREYLKRVIDEHPGTPWAALASHELGRDLGWEWQEFRGYVPGMAGMGADPDDPQLLLADEEERRREEMRNKPRNRPKL